MGEALTIDIFNEVRDRLYRFPQETHWYLCHPDDLARLRETFAPVRWGTCPIIEASEYLTPGKVLEIAYNTDPKWLWPWQRETP